MSGKDSRDKLPASLGPPPVWNGDELKQAIQGFLITGMAVAPPSYCFVAFPPRAKDGLVVFGKNSARPRDEVQEVVYFSAADHEPESKVEPFKSIKHHQRAIALYKELVMLGEFSRSTEMNGQS
ncbi:hypothetical protein E5288_WYG014474 [Bos mutus]|uniref:Uncharacterized protein n=1 Tax=Bos mutus TaxID=72004 RepID=A0A6B0RAR6_9CETA|nr:hypothetical protein [Bos mutus]